MEQGPNGGYGRLKEDSNSPPPQYGYEMNSGQPAYPTQVNNPQHQAHYATNTSTTVIAPNAPTIIRTQTVPDDNLGLAIFTTICCFWPVGIFAIMKSRDVHRYAWQGDTAGSEQAARSARQLSFVALGVGIAIISLCVLLPIISIFAIGAAVGTAETAAISNTINDLNNWLEPVAMETTTTSMWNMNLE